MTMPALQGEGLSKSFLGVNAIVDVSFLVPDASLTALIGPNGAGKSTLFNLITNLYRPDSGEVRLFGTPLRDLQPHRIAALGLIRTFQTARAFRSMTVMENALIGAHRKIGYGTCAEILRLPGVRRTERRMTARAAELLELCGLHAFRDVPAGELPMGAQKLLEVVRALMAQPRVLLLDEPAAGLNDHETAQLAAFLGAVRACGITVMVVEHNMTLVMSIADHVIVLDAGSVVASGTPAQIQQSKRVIEAYVGSAEVAA